ncbi:MAG TPA: hypothetical protein PKK06_05425 [Phycisphaerae bacterium]|nr:hypothetical protein [Phycisphaerae bacterium]HNU44802.1 hypothetical protein [Phycisphaerae bacterium]
MSGRFAGLMIVAGLIATPAWGLEPLGTAFTYQGQFKQAGVPVTGDVDFIFGLYGAATGGILLGQNTLAGTDVVNGLFTVELDFGGAFFGNARWIEIQARYPAGGGSYTTLTPRQPVSATPYALYALNSPGSGAGYWAANGDDIYATNAGNVGIGKADPAAPLHLVGVDQLLNELALYNDDLILEDGDAVLGLFSSPGGNYGSAFHLAELSGGDLVDKWSLYRTTSGATPGSQLRFSFGANANYSDNPVHLCLSTDGSVGIGTTSPATRLDVAGTVKTTGFQLTTGAQNGYVLTSDAAGLASWQPAGAGACLWDANGSSVYYSDGYVGVGTSAPTSHLEVSKPYDSASPYVLELTRRYNSFGTQFDRLTFDGTSIDSSSSFIVGSMDINGTSDHDVLLVNGGGNVGVGTTDPDVRLHVDNGTDAGPGSGGYVVVGPVTSLNLAMDDNELMARNNGVPATLFINNGGGSVTVGGLGTTTHALNVIGVGQNAANAPLQAHNYQANAGIAAHITNNSNTATMHVQNDGSGEVLWLQREETTGPFIVAYDEQTASRPFQVNADGRTICTILQITGGADLSEQFRVAAPERKPAPGSVVCIDSANPGGLVVSSRAYDRTVAGVISGAGGINPGMVMGQENSVADGEHPVALTGRVWCRCVSSNGPIQPGDLLTTSDVPGCAMKVTDHDRAHGATIGKAMTGLAEGDGLVLVLVSLQ